MNKLFSSVLLISFLFMSCSSNSFEQRVKSSVKMQLEQYPLSTLQDLYKSFFQDKFGPGHLINDTTAAQRYLASELMSFETSANPKVEPTGWEHNFYRINLSVLKDSTIPYDVFFTAFIESTNNIATPSIEEWKKEWASIEEIIYSMNPPLPSYHTDKKTIDSLLDAGKYVMHHSQAYSDAYEPHYRIVDRKVFERNLQQYFDK